MSKIDFPLSHQSKISPLEITNNLMHKGMC